VHFACAFSISSYIQYTTQTNKEGGRGLGGHCSVTPSRSSLVLCTSSLRTELPKPYVTRSTLRREENLYAASALLMSSVCEGKAGQGRATQDMARHISNE
jgi:hypothetical protein